MMIDYEKELLSNLVKKYKINNDDLSYIMDIIKPIITHEEFLKRCTEEFLHHDELTLGYHLLEDMFVSFLLCKKKNLLKEQVRNVLLIAMMHDLYELPWQNNIESKSKRFFHKHGFRHPIEAAINSAFWFPEFFEDEQNAEILIDGIIHHMFPLPVLSINYDNYKNLEIKNIKIFDKLDDGLKDIIIASANRSVIGPVSISSSLYIEGKIVRKADKLSSLDNFSSISGILALLTGNNRHIKSERNT